MACRLSPYIPELLKSLGGSAASRQSARYGTPHGSSDDGRQARRDLPEEHGRRRGASTFNRVNRSRGGASTIRLHPVRKQAH